MMVEKTHKTNPQDEPTRRTHLHKTEPTRRTHLEEIGWFWISDVERVRFYAGSYF